MNYGKQPPSKWAGMEITVSPTALEGVLVVDTDFFRDERGFFIESYNDEQFARHGINAQFVQDNHSGSARGVLRGLHYQDMTVPMGKLVRCTSGSIFDVAVDIRVGSPTFGRWVGIDLTADNMRQLWIPPGFAHGFATTSDHAEVQYKCSGRYAPAAEGSLAWNDPDLAIAWPISDPMVSRRDAQGMTLREYLQRPAFRF